MNDETIKIQRLKQEKTTPTYKTVFSTSYKIELIYNLERALNIERFNFDKKDTDEPLKIDDNLIKKINVSFRCTKTPKTYNEYIDYYEKK